MRLGAVDSRQRTPDQFQDRFRGSKAYALHDNRSQRREGPRRLKGCSRIPRNLKSRRLLPSCRRLTCPIVVLMACAAMVYAAQNCLQSRFEGVSFGFSLKVYFVLTLQQTQGRWYNGVTYCRSSYIHDCIGLHMSGCYILVNNFVLRTVIPKYEQSYNTESGQRFLKVLLV